MSCVAFKVHRMPVKDTVCFIIVFVVFIDYTKLNDGVLICPSC